MRRASRGVLQAGRCVGEAFLGLRDHGMEVPWFCDEAAALTGLKYAWAIASLAVNRSWRQG